MILDPYKNNVIHQYQTELKTCKEIAEFYNCSTECVTTYLKKHCGIQLRGPRDRKMPALDRVGICQKYKSGVTGPALAKEYNLCERSIYNILEAAGIDRRYFVNEVKEDFFSTWSEDMAYILGFITADGNVGKRKPYLNIELQQRDKCALEYIRDCISPTANILPQTHCDKRSGKIYHSNKLSIHSYKLVQDLKQFSVFPNKTGNHLLDFDIPQEYQHSYTRGFFDADGSVFFKNGLCNSSIVCKSELFLRELKSLNGLHLGRIGHGSGKHRYLWNWRMAYKHSKKFADYIYQSYNFSLERKRIRFV